MHSKCCVGETCTQGDPPGPQEGGRPPHVARLQTLESNRTESLLGGATLQHPGDEWQGPGAARCLAPSISLRAPWLSQALSLPLRGAHLQCKPGDLPCDPSRCSTAPPGSFYFGAGSSAGEFSEDPHDRERGARAEIMAGLRGTFIVQVEAFKYN